MNLYEYRGSVSLYGDIVIRDFRAKTRAVSEAKAKSNFRFQALKRLGLERGPIKLVGEARLSY